MRFTLLLALAATTLFCIACPGSVSPVPSGDASWQDAPPLSLGAQQESAVFSAATGSDGALEVIVLGGYDDDMTQLDRVVAFSPETESWRALPDLPVPLHHAHASAVGDTLFVLGFLTGLGFSPDPRGFVLRRGDDAWTATAPLPAPTDRGGGACVAHAGKLYVIGGYNGGAMRDVHRYDPETDRWSTLAPLPAPRDHLVAGSVGDLIVVAGGRERAIDAHHPDTYMYAPARDEWRSGAPMPTSRAGTAGAVLDGRLFVIGGEGNPDAQSGVFADVEAYDPISDEWTAFPPMPAPRHGMGAATVDGAIYVPGGAPTRGFDATDVHEVLTLD